VFVMILCVHDLLMPVEDIQAEKMGVQSFYYYYYYYYYYYDFIFVDFLLCLLYACARKVWYIL